MDRVKLFLTYVIDALYPRVCVSDIERIDRDKNDPMIVDVILTWGDVVPGINLRTSRNVFAHPLYSVEFEDDDYYLENAIIRYFAINGRQVGKVDFMRRIYSLTDEEYNALLRGEFVNGEEDGFLYGKTEFDEDVFLGKKKLKLY